MWVGGGGWVGAVEIENKANSAQLGLNWDLAEGLAKVLFYFVLPSSIFPQIFFY